MNYRINKPARSDIQDAFWLGFVILVLALIVLYGGDILSYVAGNNVLKGDF